jgi:hypothetical protein
VQADVRAILVPEFDALVLVHCRLLSVAIIDNMKLSSHGGPLRGPLRRPPQAPFSVKTNLGTPPRNNCIHAGNRVSKRYAPGKNRTCARGLGNGGRFLHPCASTPARPPGPAPRKPQPGAFILAGVAGSAESSSPSRAMFGASLHPGVRHVGALALACRAKPRRRGRPQAGSGVRSPQESSR